MIQQLTPRERDILLRVQFSNKEIAHELGISRQTVANLWTRIYARLDVDGRPPRMKRLAAILVALRTEAVTMSEIIWPKRSLR